MSQVLTNMADAMYKVTGLAKKKGKVVEVMTDLQYQQHAASPISEKEEGSDKQKSDYYDDRLSRDSQLDSHLKEFVSDGVECGEFGGISAGLFSAHEEDHSAVEDEFYEETEETEDQVNQPAETCIAGEIISPAKMEEMLGGWGLVTSRPPHKLIQLNRRHCLDRMSAVSYSLTSRSGKSTDHRRRLAPTSLHRVQTSSTRQR